MNCDALMMRLHYLFAGECCHQWQAQKGYTRTNTGLSISVWLCRLCGQWAWLRSTDGNEHLAILANCGVLCDARAVRGQRGPRGPVARPGDR